MYNFFIIFLIVKTIFANDKVNYSDYRNPSSLFLDIYASFCETLQCIVLSVLFAIDRGHEREKIKNLLAHGQFSGSSKIIHQAYNGDFRVSPMINFRNWNASRASRQSCG